MKKPVIVLLIMFTAIQGLFGYKTYYAEQFYKLYHQHFYQYPEDAAENIYYLGMALRSDFANPLYALAKIEDEKEWEKYRYLFYMHINLKLTENYLKLGARYDKFKAYFYNAPWKEQNLKSLEIAESYYVSARQYWRDAVVWSEKASEKGFRWIDLEEIHNWEDESYRITQGELNYDTIIDRQLTRLHKVRAEFEAMDETTY